MAKKDRHVSETPATQWLRRHGVVYSEHPYDYVDHGGTAEPEAGDVFGAVIPAGGRGYDGDNLGGGF